MTDDLVKRLREKPYRQASETEEQAKLRRQTEREAAADRIEALTAERDALQADSARLKKRLRVRHVRNQRLHARSRGHVAPRIGNGVA
jgi:hypothetical protein